MERKRARLRQHSVPVSDIETAEEWIDEASSLSFHEPEEHHKQQENILFFNSDEDRITPLNNEKEEVIDEEECGSYFTNLFAQREKERREKEKMLVEIQQKKDQRNAELMELRNNQYARRYRVARKDPASAFQLKLAVINQMTADELGKQAISERREFIRRGTVERQRNRELVSERRMCILKN